MKKLLLLVLLLGIVFTSSALGSEAITMQDVFDAFRQEAILAAHESVLMRRTWSGGEYSGEIEYYLTEDFCFYTIGTLSEYVTDNSYYHREGDVCRRIVCIAPDGLTDMSNVRASLSTDLAPMTLKEEIQSVTEEDGRIIVISVLAKESIEELREQVEDLSFGSCEYVLDAKTHTPLSKKDSYIYEDGTVEEGVLEFAYDTEMTEGMKTLMALDRQTEDLCTVTLVFHPGTEKENTVSVQVPRGVDIGLYPYNTNEQFKAYVDAECTELYTFPEHQVSDETLYIQWGA